MDDLQSLPVARAPLDAPPATAHSEAAGDLTDEEQARRARQQYRDGGLPRVEADGLIAPHLRPGETVVGVRASARIARIDEASRSVAHEDGRIYVTTERLLHLGTMVTSLPLIEIEELSMADDLILVSTTGLRGLVLETSGPRQLRVLLSAARSALRP